MNKLIITGNCGHDCNPKQVNDKYVYNLSLAVSTGLGDNKTTTWYDVNIWRNDDKLGTIAKGTKLLIEGEPTIEEVNKQQRVSSSAASAIREAEEPTDGVPF